MRILLPIMTIVLVAIYAMYQVSVHKATTTQQVYDYCDGIAKKQHEEYKDTIFKDFNFYQSCVDNVRCTSPIKECY